MRGDVDTERLIKVGKSRVEKRRQVAAVNVVRRE
jgi:hypothetical protein